jgi:predicted Mrr-cat superfamily restriction endonuclease
VSLWGIHGLVNEDFVNSGQIALERPMVGDLMLLGDDRERIKQRLRLAYPQERPGTIVAWASVLRRFAFDADEGDLVVHPNRRRRSVSVGRIKSPYRWDANGGSDRHLRLVEWLAVGIPRDRLSDEAKQAVSARVAFFEIRRAAAEFERLAG